MDVDRRAVLKTTGVAAFMGTTGLAGCSGLPGSGGSGGGWQYDPTLLVDAGNVFFGSMDYATIYENRELFPEDTRNSLESTSETGIDPANIDILSGVGAANVSLDGSSGSGAGSVAVEGSFDTSGVTEEIESGGDATEIGSYEGYTLYESSSLGEEVPNPESSGSAVAGVGDGAVVVGFAGAVGSSSGTTARDAVETAIDSNNGNARPLRGNNEFATSVLDSLGDATFQFGGVGDPALIEEAASTASSSAQQYVTGLRAGGAGMSFGAETTTFDVILAYESGQAAEDTGLASLVDGLAPQVEQQEGINEISTSQDGGTITITVEGDTETLLQQAGSTAPGGGF
jgi:hypothetical protein